MCIGVLYTYICKIYAIIFRFSCTRCTNAAISLTHGNLQPPTTYSPFVLGSFLSRNIFFDFFFLSIQRKEKRLKDDWPRLSLVLIVQYEIKQDERQAVLSRRKELASTEIIFSPNESRRARVWTENRRMRGETRWTLFYVLEFIHRRETDKRRTGRGPKKKRREKNREGELIQVSWLKSVVVIVVVLVSYRGSYNVSSTVVFIFRDSWLLFATRGSYVLASWDQEVRYGRSVAQSFVLWEKYIWSMWSRSRWSLKMWVQVKSRGTETVPKLYGRFFLLWFLFFLVGIEEKNTCAFFSNIGIIRK